jgi:hypothetical protein
MGSFMDCCRKGRTPRYIDQPVRRWRLRARTSIAAWLLISALAAAALSVENASIGSRDNGYFLDADFSLSLNGTLEDALSRGVVLYFVIEGRLWRTRWWWFNDTVAAIQETRELSYNSLTRQYRLSSDNQYQNFSSLDDAETALSQVRNWKIADAQSLDNDARYRGSVRMWLDVTQLPKPFQVKAVTANEWKLDSGELVFDVNL